MIEIKDLKRLHNHGLALHWLRPKSKVPVESGWTKGPRLEWDDFKRRYRKGFNVGVRLGSASKVGGDYLAVIDLDVKSSEARHQEEAERKLRELFPEAKGAPRVDSGRGNGSGHRYVRVPKPIAGSERKAQSAETVRVKMPSVPPSKNEKSQLSEEELAAGWRLRPAWEISLLSEGRQVVLPGSIHPDTGRAYEWVRPINGSVDSIPRITAVPGMSAASKPVPEASPASVTPSGFKVEPVDVDKLGLRPEQVAAIETGEGVEDRSAYCFGLAMSLIQRGVSDNAILNLLSDRRHWLAATAFEHAKTETRARAVRWLDRYVLRPAHAKVEESVFDEVEELPRADAVTASVKGSDKLETNSEENGEDWRATLDLQGGTRGAPPTVRATFKNAVLILQNELGFDLLKRNLFEEGDLWNRETPWGYQPGRKRSGGMDDALHVKGWLIEKYSVECSLTLIDEALTAIALENQFHPVKDFLESLEWDGVERVPTAFKRYLKAEMPEPYLTAVTRKFFLALIARIYQPGIKFDHVVIFEGKQGIGKSTFASILVGEKWFLDGLPNLQDKDSALNLQGIWLVEMGELSSLYRSELEAAKAFITRTTDKVRPPYGRRREEYPRSCVFVGTTNDHEYLLDATGGRRFWSVLVHGCDFEGIKRDRLQLLAEAKFLYDFCMEPLYLRGPEKKQAVVIQDSRRVEDEGDEMKTAFLEWLDKKPEERDGSGLDLNRFKLDDLWNGPWEKLNLNKSMANRKAAGRVLRQMGFIRKHSRKGKVWVASRYLKTWKKLNGS